MCWTLRTTSGGNPIGITGLAVMSRSGRRTWRPLSPAQDPRKVRELILAANKLDLADGV